MKFSRNRFMVDCYVRGAKRNQKTVRLEDNTACFTKRRYRDAWNRTMLQRRALMHSRSMRVKAVFATGGTEAQWIRDEAASAIRRTVRSQCLPNFRLAGQWLGDPPTEDDARPHCMRAMLVANIDVANRFANGATGRIVAWGPEQLEEGKAHNRRTILANTPGPVTSTSSVF